MDNKQKIFAKDNSDLQPCIRMWYETGSITKLPQDFDGTLFHSNCSKVLTFSNVDASQHATFLDESVLIRCSEFQG